MNAEEAVASGGIISVILVTCFFLLSAIFDATSPVVVPVQEQEDSIEYRIYESKEAYQKRYDLCYSLNESYKDWSKCMIQLNRERENEWDNSKD